MRDQDAGGAFLQNCWSQENIIIYAEKYIHTWPNHPYDYLIEIIKNKPHVIGYGAITTPSNLKASERLLMINSNAVLRIFFN